MSAKRITGSSNEDYSGMNSVSYTHLTISKFAKKINSISIGHGAIRVTSDFIHKNTNPKIAGNIP